MTPCTSCRRHVALEETACPFCGAAVTASAPRPIRAVGKLTRSAVFAGASLASGCWVDKAPPPTTPQPPVHHTQSTASVGSIRGVVTDRATGRPVDQVWIQITPNPYNAEDHDRNKDSTTDANGRYSIDLPPGDYRVAVQSADRREARPEHLVTLQAGDSLSVDFQIPVAPTPPMPMPYGAPPARRRIV
jgi:hypothetical protein